MPHSKGGDCVDEKQALEQIRAVVNQYLEGLITNDEALNSIVHTTTLIGVQLID